jgi:hypothetical protein
VFNEFVSGQPWHRFLWRVAHIAPIGYLAIVIAFVPIDLIVSPSLRIWVGAPTLALAVPLLLAHRAHELALCEICATRTPLNGSDAAQRNKIQLRLFHKGRTIAYVMVAMLAAVIGASWILHWPEIIGHLAFNISFVETAVSMHVSITHNLLKPWCPWCHWGGGGDHEPSPEPTPPVGQATT